MDPYNGFFLRNMYIPGVDIALSLCRSGYCISTLSTANVVVVLSWVVVPTVSFRFLLCVLYHVWHWLGCVFSLFEWLFWTLWSCFVECRCFVFFTNIRLENMFPPDYFCFGADAAQGVFTDYSSRTSCWWVFRKIVNVIIKTAICTYWVCIVSMSTLSVFLPLQSWMPNCCHDAMTHLVNTF